MSEFVVISSPDDPYEARLAWNGLTPVVMVSAETLGLSEDVLAECARRARIYEKFFLSTMRFDVLD